MQCKFLTDVLSGGKAADKKKAIMSDLGRRLCGEMLLWERFKLFKHFVDLCLHGAEAIAFKIEVIVDNSRIFLQWISQEKSSKLDEFLANCFSADPLEVAEVKARLLLSERGITLCTENVQCRGYYLTRKPNPEQNYRLFTEMLTNADGGVKKELVHSYTIVVSSMRCLRVMVIRVC